MKLFNNKNKKAEDKNKSARIKEGEETGNQSEEQVVTPDIAFSGNQSADAYKVLKSFYVSEKASIGIAINQYVFRVFVNANKSEVRKEVSKLFNVKVKRVKILNMPKKRRDLGKHPGFRSGFKKAIVVLEEGYTIGQAKP